MAERVKPKRRYHSPHRQEQAAATRVAILEAAHRLFERHGYGTTTMAADAAAPLDSDIAALWDRIQSDYHANQRLIVESLNEKGALTAGLDVDRATDMLWTINHPNMWHLLVGERSWTPEQYEHWTADLACSQLLAAQD